MPEDCNKENVLTLVPCLFLHLRCLYHLVCHFIDEVVRGVIVLVPELDLPEPEFLKGSVAFL
jgi:hypothetical protein